MLFSLSHSCSHDDSVTGRDHLDNSPTGPSDSAPTDNGIATVSNDSARLNNCAAAASSNVGALSVDGRIG